VTVMVALPNKPEGESCETEGLLYVKAFSFVVFCVVAR
jgi:hypothetical protein